MIPKTGDIVGIRGQGWLSSNIIKATNGRISHVGLVIAGNPPIVIEALTRVETNPWEKTISGAEAVYLYRPKNLAPIQLDGIIYKALSFTTESYGYIDIGLQGLDALTKSRFFTEHLAGFLWIRSHPICSYVVAESFSAEGFHFGIPNKSITPADIDRFCVSHPEFYMVE